MVSTNRHKGKTLDRINDTRIIDCSVCGFVHAVPLPNDAELTKLYEQEFYQHEKPNYFKETKEDLPWWMATYDNYYTLFERYTKGRTLLDIGSGPGHFLACGKKRRWKTVGIEPSPSAAQYSTKRGLTVVNDFFRYTRAKKLGTFDVVHAALVLEHVPDPIGFMRDMKKMLKPRGLIAIFCPNDYNPLQQQLRHEHGFKPWWVAPRHHLNYFTPQSMQRLLRRLGFTIEETLGTYPLETFLLAGRNYVGNHRIGRACHGERKAFEMTLYKKNPLLLNSLYRGLIAAGMGREFLIIARKQ